MEGGGYGAPHPETRAHAKMFSGKYEHWTHHRRHGAQPADVAEA
jgi:hypothetical protein